MTGSEHAASATLALADETATAALGRQLAEGAARQEVIALSGPLGAGKTVLARAFIRALAGEKTTVPSPTFTLVQTYDVPGGMLWHLDLYRLDRAEDVWELGFEDALGDVALLIEWPERLGALLPARRLDVMLSSGATSGERVARLRPRGGSGLLARAGLARRA